MGTDCDTAMKRLREAAKGLTYMSETDAPLEPFACEGAGKGAITGARVRELMGIDPKTSVKTTSLDRFFEPPTREWEWHNEDERQTVQRFKELVKALKESLDGIKVVKVGKINQEVYVVGRTATGNLAGLKTRVVET